MGMGMEDGGRPLFLRREVLDYSLSIVEHRYKQTTESENKVT